MNEDLEQLKADVDKTAQALREGTVAIASEINLLEQRLRTTITLVRNNLQQNIYEANTLAEQLVERLEERLAYRIDALSTSLDNLSNDYDRYVRHHR